MLQFYQSRTEKTEKPVTVVLDCFPTRSVQELTSELTQKSKQSKKTLANAWHGFLPERLLLFS